MKGDVMFVCDSGANPADDLLEDISIHLAIPSQLIDLGQQLLGCCFRMLQLEVTQSNTVDMGLRSDVIAIVVVWMLPATCRVQV